MFGGGRKPVLKQTQRFDTDHPLELNALLEDRCKAWELGMPELLIGWAIAHAAIAAVWHRSAGGSGQHPLIALGLLFDAQTELA
jgi:hypothetical protein